MKFRACLLLLCAVAALAGCTQGDAQEIVEEVVRPVPVMEVVPSNLPVIRTYPGRVQAADEVNLAFEVSGRINNLRIKSGQNVQKGDVVARLDDTDFRSRYDSACADAAKKKSDLERYKQLLEQGVVARSEYDSRLRDYSVASSEVRIARKALDDTVLMAPFSGVIGSTFVESWQNVQAKEQIASLQRRNDVEIVLDVPEKDVLDMKKQSSRFYAELKILPGERYSLTIDEFSREADEQTRTYRVVLTMPAPGEVDMMTGMSATVYHVMVPEKDASCMVPSNAVFKGPDDQACVWVVDRDWRVRRTPVQVASLSGSDAVITDGLRPGTNIATAGVNTLVEGMAVRRLSRVSGGE
jgi:RND family efflux transporter MFP subunit